LSNSVSPQFRHHAFKERTRNQVDLEGQQQVLRATFPGIRDCVRKLLSVRMDALTCRFQETKDLKVSDEIYRLAGEYGKLLRNPQLP